MPDDNQETNLDNNQDNLTPEQFDATGQVTFEKLMADYDAQQANEDGDPTQGETPQTTQEIELDGEKIPFDQLKELVSKGKDYTRKTMELSDQRKQLEQEAERVKWVRDLEAAWNSGQEGKTKLIEALMKEAGYTPAQQSALPQVDMDDMSDEAKFIFQSLKQENQKLQAQLSHVTQQSTQALSKFEEYIREQQGTDAAQVAAANIKEEFGAEVTPADLRKLSKDTGISDYEAAWLKANKEQVKKGLFKAGHQQGQRAKPNSPTGQTRTFDPDATGMTADKILQNLMKGYQPVSK